MQHADQKARQQRKEHLAGDVVPEARPAEEDDRAWKWAASWLFVVGQGRDECCRAAYTPYSVLSTQYRVPCCRIHGIPLSEPAIMSFLTPRCLVGLAILAALP